MISDFQALMATTVLAAALMASGTAGSEAPASLRQEAPLFRSRADAVMLTVAVQRRGRPVSGLSAEDFRVLDNGVPQQIAAFSYEALPIDVTIVLDISASVSGRVLEDLRRAIGQLRADLREDDRLKLMTFNMRVRRDLDFTASAEAVDQAIRSIRPFGSSAVLDALAVTLATPVPEGRRQLVVLFSDGQDSSSIIDSETLLGIVRRTTPTVTIAIASPLEGPRDLSTALTASRFQTVREEIYRMVAAETGGTLLRVTSRENLTSTFRRTLMDFRSSYVLHFVPTGVETGGVHRLDVQVNRDGLEVRTRREYEW